MEESAETVDSFIEKKMAACFQMFDDWLLSHPDATPEDASDELFQILMGKRVQ